MRARVNYSPALSQHHVRILIFHPHCLLWATGKTGTGAWERGTLHAAREITKSQSNCGTEEL